ncbi:efflux RND transporter periplasmic adaptor subunit [Kushneria aurantia]|uniref:Efflux RND transporter periplasmic adaptor subunit n=1 Tax=Kushneria aurantia TaxID=504092 RepID=A0ABV6G4C7_9GAMM|nr:efflux RND transporter periplasmic adaptor subunit [Kushneria aurantia]
MNHKLAGWSRRWALPAACALLLSACSGGGEGQQGQQQGQQQQPPKQAEVLSVEPRDLELDKSYPAMVRSDRSVDLVARVDGYLESQNFEPGEMVEQGQTLFVIEQAPYEAAVAQARADVQSARASNTEAQRNYERYERLYNTGSISQQQLDQALSNRNTARAAVAQAQAALESAQIDLGYTEVTSPTEGYVSLNQVNVGNYVPVQTLLASVTPVDPLEVRFALPQDDAFALRRQRGMQDAPQIVPELDFPFETGGMKDRSALTGDLNFLGSQVDQSTSTISARAVFDNPGQLFLPGQFVRVRLRNLMRFNVIAVPEIAVTEGLKGPQVMVLSDDNTAQNRFVSLGAQARGWVIITDGLQSGERVIVSNIGGISTGNTIDPQPFNGLEDQMPQDESGSSAGQDGGSGQGGGSGQQGSSGGGASGQSGGASGQGSGDSRGQNQ